MIDWQRLLIALGIYFLATLFLFVLPKPVDPFERRKYRALKVVIATTILGGCIGDLGGAIIGATIGLVIG